MWPAVAEEKWAKEGAERSRGPRPSTSLSTLPLGAKPHYRAGLLAHNRAGARVHHDIYFGTRRIHGAEGSLTLSTRGAIQRFDVAVTVIGEFQRRIEIRDRIFQRHSLRDCMRRHIIQGIAAHLDACIRF